MSNNRFARSKLSAAEVAETSNTLADTIVELTATKAALAKANAALLWASKNALDWRDEMPPEIRRAFGAAHAATGEPAIPTKAGTQPANDVKPHMGSIAQWRREMLPGHGLGYRICGQSIDHPRWGGCPMYTSYVVKHDEATGEIETRNSRYTLIGPEGKGR